MTATVKKHKKDMPARSQVVPKDGMHFIEPGHIPVMRPSRAAGEPIGRRTKSSRGRRSKASEIEILRTQGLVLAEMFKSEPLREPIDRQFIHCYEQILKGNARAIVEYCDDHWERGTLADSFYEMLGRLFTVKFYRVADTVLKNIEHRGMEGFPSDRQSYRLWYRRLKPLCDSARDFIKTDLESKPGRTREARWDAYVARPVRELRNKQDREHHEQRQQAIQDGLLQGADSVVARADNQCSESGHLITLVNGFGLFKLLFKEAFFDLTLTRYQGERRKFRYTQSEIARKYACRITGLSESTVSHWKS